MLDDSSHLESLLARLGATLLNIQTAEKIIRFCLTYVIQRQELTVESLQTQEADEARKTIGYFLAELRKRVEVEVAFDEVLRQFLNLRNIVVHNLDKEPRWGLEKANYESSAEFLDQVSDVTWEVINVFAGLMRAYQRQTGIKTSFDNDDVLVEIEQKYADRASQIFFSKA
jgi:hypothetical protein